MPAAFQPRGCRVEVNGQIKYDEAREDPNRVVKVIDCSITSEFIPGSTRRYKRKMPCSKGDRHGNEKLQMIKAATGSRFFTVAARGSASTACHQVT